MSVVIGRSIPVHPVGDDQADGSGVVSQQVAKPGNGRAFHFVVCHFVAVVTEFRNPVIDARHGQRQAQNPSLRSVETYGGEGHSLDCLPSVCKRSTSSAEAFTTYGRAALDVQLTMADKSILERFVANAFVAFVKAQYSSATVLFHEDE